MVTIKDVARHAKVHPSTVSRVIKNHKSISNETKHRVLEAMNFLGYVPNYAAQTLATGQSFNIGVVLPPLLTEEKYSEPFFLHILSVIVIEAKKLGYTISVASALTLSDLQEQVELMYSQKRVDGFMLLFNSYSNPIKEFLDKNSIPTVIIGTPNHDKTGIFIDNDNFQMGYDAANFLIKNGHTELLFVTDTVDSMVFSYRYQGFKRLCEQRKLTSHHPVIYGTNYFFEEELISIIKKCNISSMVIIGDKLSLRVIQLLVSKGFSVPDDISVITFNNSDYSTLVSPYLTTFDINIEELGKQGLIALIHQIKKRNFLTIKETFIPFLLVERDSIKSRV